MQAGMSRKKIFRKSMIAILLAVLVILVLSGSFYAYWNSASPEKTCASCHEIENSVQLFSQSAHRDLACRECHGTALSNGWHSLREKGMMLVNHARMDYIEEIRLTEKQVLEVMNSCKRCHTREYAKWNTGGHSARYRHIFLDLKHNQTEQLNADCLRCHGMFSDVPIQEVVEPLDIRGPWKLKNAENLDNPAIPCQACHQVHDPGTLPFSPDYSNPRNLFYLRLPASDKVSFYSRAERKHIPAEDLPKLKLTEGERPVRVSDDLIMRNCIQCHAPNAHHLAGTSDDRTPRGVHEGLSCTVCHVPHSNDARQSCAACHPAISNCGRDVERMNTSFADRNSPNNIHWVACRDCHNTGLPVKNKNK
jgi:hypothetical protein